MATDGCSGGSGRLEQQRQQQKQSGSSVGGSLSSLTSARKLDLCSICGQFHEPGAVHLYDYNQAVDADLLCMLCRQPLVEPLDTKCGHTYCTPCLKNHLAKQALCPLDSCIINFLECSQSSGLVKKLLDKLLVVCPNVDYCEEVLPRCELEAHLQHRCRGAVTRCSKAAMGCTFQGPRTAMQNHLWECPFRSEEDEVNEAETVADLPPKTPIASGEVTTIEIPRGCYDLGVSFVGGLDTPLSCIVIQEIYIDGLVAKDGRLRPGDQILEVNGEDLTQATHCQAKRALSQLHPICRLTVYRERTEEPPAPEKEETLEITLNKRSGKALGIKLVGKKTCSGLYVLGLVDGGLAAIDGRLRRDDRILKIDGRDISGGTQSEAAEIIQSAGDKVTFVVSRRARSQTPDLLRAASGEDVAGACESGSSGASPVALDGRGGGRLLAQQQQLQLQQQQLQQTLLRPSAFVNRLELPAARDQLVVIDKEPGESLGMSVAGGVGSQRGDIPVYVTNLQPDGIVGRTRMVKKGDVVLTVNDMSLLALTHEESVRILKEAAACGRVSIRLLEGPESSSGGGNFMPSWVYWLSLPTLCYVEKDIDLTRDPCTGSLGFSIVGGSDSLHGPQPIIAKSVVHGGPAHEDGRLRCGDIITRVNHISLKDFQHAQAVNLLKTVRTETVVLTVVSWPGTIV